MTEAEETDAIERLTGSYLQNGGHDWSVTLLPGDVLRYEIRQGDGPEGDTVLGKQRTEVSGYGRTWDYGTPIEINYRLMIEPGPRNTAQWLVMGQVQSANPGTPFEGQPPVGVVLLNERIGLHLRYWNDDQEVVLVQAFRDDQDIVRGRWYDIKLQVLIDPEGGGYARFWIDGEQVLNYAGRLGYADAYATVWKQGIYRAIAPETMVLNIDDLTVHGAADTFAATTGDDTFRVDNPADTITGSQDGIDEIRTQLLRYTLPEGVENLSFVPGGQAHYTGTGNAQANRITGAARGDTLQGMAGHDTLLGLEDNDSLLGGEGDDWLDGGQNTDILFGEAGRDTLVGGSTTDTLDGGAGDDWLDAGGNPGWLIGGAGNDTYAYTGALPTIIETTGGGIDAIVTPRFLEALPDHIENLTLLGTMSPGTGNALANRITGNGADNQLRGRGGNDAIFGELGDDNLQGEDANDLLHGGAGNDRLNGGAGSTP